LSPVAESKKRAWESVHRYWFLLCCL